MMPTAVRARSSAASGSKVPVASDLRSVESCAIIAESGIVLGAAIPVLPYVKGLYDGALSRSISMVPSTFLLIKEAFLEKPYPDVLPPFNVLIARS